MKSHQGSEARRDSVIRSFWGSSDGRGRWQPCPLVLLARGAVGVTGTGLTLLCLGTFSRYPSESEHSHMFVWTCPGELPCLGVSQNHERSVRFQKGVSTWLVGKGCLPWGLLVSEGAAHSLCHPLLLLNSGPLCSASFHCVPAMGEPL